MARWVPRNEAGCRVFRAGESDGPALLLCVGRETLEIQLKAFGNPTDPGSGRKRVCIERWRDPDAL